MESIETKKKRHYGQDIKAKRKLEKYLYIDVKNISYKKNSIINKDKYIQIKFFRINLVLHKQLL